MYRCNQIAIFSKFVLCISVTKQYISSRVAISNGKKLFNVGIENNGRCYYFSVNQYCSKKKFDITYKK